VRAHVPILVSQAVMDEAGIVPEHDLQGEQQIPADEALADPSVKNEEDLDVFEDFLKKLKDDPGDDQRPEEKK
jgi:uncharacterized membrane-anchored protein YjiN (DUF445 family)